ncbi:MAG TPA: peptidoglycan DD-metalloendopeptidase family protein [Acidimicrobiales bacterium]|nr:peptidoglycan DD-metalloendopeptidase family protein [Acidimicrobiales bacterium]
MRRRHDRLGRHERVIRWAAAITVAALATGTAATSAGAQAPEAPGPGDTPAEPPADNVFPVPMPYTVDFDDTWHACRDGCRRQHKGNDLLTDEGNPAVAVETGVIAKVDNIDDGLGGLTVWLRGDSGVAYYYAHNSENLVAEGDRVVRGQTIARVGRTGNAATTPPHIHFQINVCGELSSSEPCTVDPYPYLQSWAQGMVDGGPDGVGWYQPSTEAFGQRADTGSPLPAFPFEHGGDAGAGVVPLAGDWDGDGRDSVGLYVRADAAFHLRDDEGDRYRPVDFGVPGRRDVWPLAGDFDGDGRDTVGLYAQEEGTVVVLLAEGAESPAVRVGNPGDTGLLPVVGDWDGDGRDSIGVFRRDDGAVRRLDDDGRPMEPARAPGAGPEALPVAGDWDGDGRDEVGVLHRDTATFELPAPQPSDADATRTVRLSGGADVLPVAGDWNGRDMVTIDELRQIYGNVPDVDKVAEGLPALNAAMRAAGISTPARKAAFLATLRSESAFRYDAVEAGNDSRYRGRGYIQLTGRANYEAAGDSLDLDLAGEPDLAINPLASPAIAAWYWTVARNINAAADELDMAAVNIAIGFEPSVRRDMMRCGDFIVALRYYSGGTTPEGVNCARTAASAMLAFSSVMPFGGSGGGAPSGTVSIPEGSIPEGWTPSSPPSSAPADPRETPPGSRDPGARTAPPTSSTTRPVPPPSSSPTTAPPATWSPTTDPPTTSTSPPGTTSPPSSSPPTSPSTSDGGSSTSTSSSSTTSSSSPSSTSSSSTSLSGPP